MMRRRPPKALVRAECQALGLDYLYVHAPARNISIARNAALDAAQAPLVAFIDDDETATPLWLAALLECHQQTSATIIFGPVQAVYDGGPRLAAGGGYAFHPARVPQGRRHRYGLHL